MVYENNMAVANAVSTRTKSKTYFFTATTFKKEKILTAPENVKILREAFRYVMTIDFHGKNIQ